MANIVERGLMPRHLSKSQQSAISNFLQFELHQFAFMLSNRNEEAGGYRVDTEQALLKGGWTRVEKNPYEYTEDVPKDFRSTLRKQWNIHRSQTMLETQNQTKFL
jgi:hypothetical protein